MAYPKHGKLAENFWGSTDPGTNVALGAISYIGVVYQILAPARLCGFRVWIGGGQTLSPLFLVWDFNTGALLGAYARGVYSGAGDWAQMWLRPWLRLDITHDIVVACMMSNQYRRHNTFLASAVTHGNIAAIKSFQSTSLSPWQVTPTYNTNANGVDVLFQTD